MDRDASLALLRDQHDFPGRFEFRAFIQPDARTVVMQAVTAVCGHPDEVEEVAARASRTGKWVSLRIGVRVGSAEQVLDIYAVLQDLDEVVLTL